MSKYKFFANAITSLRIIFGIALLFSKAFSPMFYAFYIICGLSDIADGFIARRFNAQSTFGSIYDTIADFIFFIICGIKILPEIDLSKFILLWAIIIFIVKIATVIISTAKRNPPIHSILDKLCGVLLFLLVFFIKSNYVLIWEITISMLATVASIEKFIKVLKK